MTTEKLAQYHTAPSEFAAAPTDADIAAERLRAATAFPAVTPAMVMVYGGAPMMSEGPPSKFDLASVEYRPDPIADLTDELATLRADNDALKAKLKAMEIQAMETCIEINKEVAQCDELRADNDARGAVIEQLRAELAKATQAATTTVSRYDLDNMRDERNQAHAAYSRALGELDDLRAAVAAANARADRQAARAERAEADLARQKRVTALMAQVAREMTRGDE